MSQPDKVTLKIDAELLLKIISGLLFILVSIVSWFGIQSTGLLKENTATMVELKLALTEVNGKVNVNSSKNKEQDDLIKVNIGDIKDHEGRIIKLETKSL